MMSWIKKFILKKVVVDKLSAYVCIMLAVAIYVVVHRNTAKIIIKEVMEDPDIVGILVKRNVFFKYWPMFFCCFLLQWVLKGNMRVSEDPTRTKMVKLEKSIKQSRYFR